jgi:cell division protein FtsW
MNIVVYFLINSAYVVGIFPTTGLPLPFMSYGGSHIILSLASMGIIFNIANINTNNKRIKYNEF